MLLRLNLKPEQNEKWLFLNAEGVNWTWIVYICNSRAWWTLLLISDLLIDRIVSSSTPFQLLTDSNCILITTSDFPLRLQTNLPCLCLKKNHKLINCYVFFLLNRIREPIAAWNGVVSRDCTAVSIFNGFECSFVPIVILKLVFVNRNRNCLMLKIVIVKMFRDYYLLDSKQISKLKRSRLG